MMVRTLVELCVFFRFFLLVPVVLFGDVDEDADGGGCHNQVGEAAADEGEGLPGGWNHSDVHGNVNQSLSHNEHADAHGKVAGKGAWFDPSGDFKRYVEQDDI